MTTESAAGASTSARPRLLDILAQRVMVFDGGMGTRLYGKGVFLNKSFDEVNLVQPTLVVGVHEEYIRAGAEVLETNTFGANRPKLAPHGLADKLGEINLQGARLAKQAALKHPGVLVAGAVGPLGLKIEPWGPTSREEARALFAEQLRWLVEGGIDIVCLETFADLNEAGEAIRAAREVAPHLPVVAQMTIDEDGCSLYGTPPEVFAARLDAWGADVIGVNCSVGPGAMLKAIERMAQVTSRPLSAQPNAGLPRTVDGRTIYLCSPEYMGSYARKFIQAGAKIVGGCCGTTPEHIRQMAAGARMLKTFHRDENPSGSHQKLPASPNAEDVRPIPFAERSKLAGKLARGEKVLLVELTPPKGCDVQSVLKKARQAMEGGADAINIPDGPRASARMSALATAVCIQNQVGIEAVLHYCCRDRNLLGMQADLLGAYALGIKNLIIITGDPPKLGDYPDATAVFDIDSIGLTNVVSRLNHGRDLGNNLTGSATGFVIGVGANPGAIDLEHEHRRFAWKCDAGAEYAVTQPVFDADAFLAFVSRVREQGFKLPIVAGIWPLVSLRNAEFMKHEVPGVIVPDAVVARMAKAQEKGKEEAMQEGVAISREVAERIKDVIAGLQISAPLGRINMALDVAAAQSRG
jgi:methionine synthase I (cobalamin-dependent)/5,10-methylenetetrahydrofolate reductase